MKTESDKSHFSKLIRQEAQNIGFLSCGFSQVRPLSEYKQHYLEWVDNGHHAEMNYMVKNIDQRLDPALLVVGAKTIISLLYNYYTFEKLENSPLQIAKYAFGEDYHEVIKAKLQQLAKFISDLTGTAIQRSYVDTGPVLEKAWAQNSGLGWIGKNSCLITRNQGSFVFIAEIITSLELEYDKPLRDYCGSCRICIDTCPTQAITENHNVDSRRCISYHTIENRGIIPNEFKGKFQNYIFGCDICQDVCPWNRRSRLHTEPLFSLRPEIRNMTLNGWKTLDEKTYQKMFKRSAVKRAKFGV